jgi:hypothetical protein
MEYISNIDEIKQHQMIFKMPVKNQNIKFLYYYKLLYSDINVHLKYLLFQINFNPSSYNKDPYTRVKIDKQDPIFEKIRKLEILLLSCMNQHVSKKIKCSLYEEFIQKDMSYVSTNHPNYQPLYLKISGIWEDHTHIGIVYKLYYAMSTVKFSNIIC